MERGVKYLWWWLTSRIQQRLNWLLLLDFSTFSLQELIHFSPRFTFYCYFLTTTLPVFLSSFSKEFTCLIRHLLGAGAEGGKYSPKPPGSRRVLGNVPLWGHMAHSYWCKWEKLENCFKCCPDATFFSPFLISYLLLFSSSSFLLLSLPPRFACVSWNGTFGSHNQEPWVIQESSILFSSWRPNQIDARALGTQSGIKLNEKWAVSWRSPQHCESWTLYSVARATLTVYIECDVEKGSSFGLRS